MTLQQARSRLIVYAQNALGAFYERRFQRYPTLRSLMTHLNAVPSIGASMSDAMALYEAVHERRPKYILDLGAGRSSAIIALAGQETGRNPEFVAVEESDEWIAHHRKVIPASLLPSIEFIQRDAEVKEFNGVRVAHYIDVPRRPYEFVHVDGPVLARLGTNISSDILELLDVLAPNCMVMFDAREDTARFAQPHFERAGFRKSRHPVTFGFVFRRDAA